FQLGTRCEWRAAEHVNGSAFRKVRSLISLQDIAGEFQLPLVAGDSIKFDQCHFDLGVARDDRLLGSRSIVGEKEIIDEPDPRVEELAFPGGAVIRDGPL